MLDGRQADQRIEAEDSPRSSSRPRWPSALVLVAVAAVCSLLIFWDLGERGLHGDEAIYATAADRVVSSGRWAPLPWSQGNFVRKPPLLIWASAGSRALLGDSEVAYRLPGALAGWLACMATLALGERLGSRLAGSIAALLLASAPGWLHLHGVRDAVTEPWLALATVASFLAAASLRGRRQWAALALLSGMNGMAKGPAGLAVVGGALLLTGAGTALRRRCVSGAEGEPVPRAARAALVAALPGTLAWLGWLRFSLPDWAEVGAVLARDIVERARTGLDPGHLNPPSMIFTTPWSDFGPFAVLGAAGLLVSVVRGWSVPAAEIPWAGRWMLASWVGAAILPVVLSASRLPWYLYPGYPALALAGGFAARDLVVAARSRSRALAGLALAGLALAGAARASALVVSWPVREGRSLATLDRLRLDDPGIRVFADAALRSQRGLDGRLRTWNAYYLRRFEAIEPGGLPVADLGCAFLVTARPGLWEASEESLGGAERVEIPRAAPGDLLLVVFDLCGGRFARAAG